MKSRSCDLVQRIGTVDSATPHPDPSGGQAPALHFLPLPAPWFPAPVSGYEVYVRRIVRIEYQAIPGQLGITPPLAGLKPATTATAPLAIGGTPAGLPVVGDKRPRDISLCPVWNVDGQFDQAGQGSQLVVTR